MPGNGSSEVAGVVVGNTESGSASQAAAVVPMTGGNMVVPLPLGGGKRKSRKLSKKVLKMLKKMGPSKVVKMIKKGGEIQGDGTDMGGRRHRRSKKTRRHSRKY